MKLRRLKSQPLRESFQLGNARVTTAAQGASVPFLIFEGDIGEGNSKDTSSIRVISQELQVIFKNRLLYDSLTDDEK